MSAKAEVARALLGGAGATVDFRFATLGSLRGAKVDALPGLSGDAVVIGVSSELLAQSRRDGGLLNKLGVFEFESMTLGALFIASDHELHAALFEPAVPECQKLLTAALSANRLHVLAFAGSKDSRLMLIDRPEALELLCAAAHGTRPGSTLEVTQAVGAALEFAASPDNFAALGFAQQHPAQVVAHFVLTPSREADIERYAAKATTTH